MPFSRYPFDAHVGRGTLGGAMAAERGGEAPGALAGAATGALEGKAPGALEGKVAVVSGATSGSGRAVARRFVREGADVVLLARGEERLLAEAESLGARAFPIATDVGDFDSVRAAFALVEARFGKVDVLVNNAAVYKPSFVQDLSDYELRCQIDTNFLGPVLTCRAAIPLLRAAGGGDIVNTSSESTLDPFPMLSIYVATKAALEAFSRTLMLELQDDDIRVTVVVQGTAYDGDGSTDWGWDDDDTEAAMKLWTERGYLARVSGHGGGQAVDDVADVHLYIVTRPRSQMLDTVHVRSH
jgi:meso-butanediol dehydrogenase / (S,S)-butanediol dehydrogenase / diacetyl reductase